MDDKQPQVNVPDDQNDRTSEQFEKLTTSNKELKEKSDLAEAENKVLQEELEKYKKLYEAPTNQVPDQKQFSNLNQQQVNQTFNSMVDENGFLDGNKLMSTLNELDAKARQAEERAQRAEQTAQETTKKTQEREEKEAQSKVYSKYPQLDPENKEAFDPKMWRAVYNALAVKARAGDNPTEKDYIEAADQVYTDFYSDNDMNKKDLEQKEEKEEQKQQINAIKPTSNMQAGYYSDLEEKDLMSNVNQGKRGSVAELLRRRGQ